MELSSRPEVTSTCSACTTCHGEGRIRFATIPRAETNCQIPSNNTGTMAPRSTDNRGVGSFHLLGEGITLGNICVVCDIS